MTRGEAKATMSALVLAPILALATMQAATAQPRPAEFQRLGDADIRARIPGRDITDDFHWTEYYRANGVLDIDGMGLPLASSASRSGCGATRSAFVPGLVPMAQPPSSDGIGRAERCGEAA